MIPTAFLWADLALTILEKLLPTISAAVTKGEITVAQQTALYDRVAALDPRKNSTFSGPEWKPSTTSP